MAALLFFIYMNHLAYNSLRPLQSILGMAHIAEKILRNYFYDEYRLSKKGNPKHKSENQLAENIPTTRVNGSGCLLLTHLTHRP